MDGHILIQRMASSHSLYKQRLGIDIEGDKLPAKLLNLLPMHINIYMPHHIHKSR